MLGNRGGNGGVPGIPGRVVSMFRIFFFGSGLSFIHLTLLPIPSPCHGPEIVSFPFPFFLQTCFSLSFHVIPIDFLSSDSKKVVGWSAGSRRQARGDGVGRNKLEGRNMLFSRCFLIITFAFQQFSHRTLCFTQSLPTTYLRLCVLC